MRSLCPTCCRPAQTCFCDLVQRTQVPLKVIIWQHPLEQNHPKGTAQLLHHCLVNSRVEVGEVFTPSQLNLSECALLYPESANGAEPVERRQAKPTQLLVIDGTWRKSRKIMHLNPWLHQLPRVSLTPSAGQYRIRKAEATHQLSTFESVVQALAAALPEENLGGLERVFEAYIARLAAFRPS